MKPIFRWAGSKQKILSPLIQEIPDGKIWIEPFLGGGSVLFKVLQENKFDKYIVNDINPAIIALYRLMQKDPHKLIAILEVERLAYNTASNKEELYYATRARYNKNKKDFGAFWLLMKVGFNGLYRENNAGYYNVPFGKKPNIAPIDTFSIFEQHALIQGVEFHCKDYRIFLSEQFSRYSKPSYLYADPPYCSSQQYTKTKFDNSELASKLYQLPANIGISDIDSDVARSVYGKFTPIVIKTLKRNMAHTKTVCEMLYVKTAETN